MQHNEDLLLGKLPVRDRICTQDQIDECLRIQSMSRSSAPLGDLLLFKGYLTTLQLRTLLSRQHKKVMKCAGCVLAFTVLTLSEGKSARCPKCKGPLLETGPQGSTQMDAESPRGESAWRCHRRRASRSGSLVSSATVSSKGAVDPSRRVRCPSCQSTFTSPKSL